MQYKEYILLGVNKISTYSLMYISSFTDTLVQESQTGQATEIMGMYWYVKRKDFQGKLYTKE